MVILRFSFIPTGKLKEDFIKQRQMGLEEFMNEIYMGKLSNSETNIFIEDWVSR